MDDKDSSEEGEDSSKGGESLSEEDLPKSVDVNTGTKFPKSNENRNKPLMLPSLKEKKEKELYGQNWYPWSSSDNILNK